APRLIETAASSSRVCAHTEAPTEGASNNPTTAAIATKRPLARPNSTTASHSQVGLMDASGAEAAIGAVLRPFALSHQHCRVMPPRFAANGRSSTWLPLNTGQF